MNDLGYAFSEYNYLLADWVFVCIACLIVALSNKGCSYKTSNGLLAGQLLLTIGFSTIFIALQIKYGDAYFYDGLHFYAPLAVIYFAFYHYISKTGNKFLAGLSLIIGGYHFAICAGIWIDLSLNQYLGVSYEGAMTVFTISQLILAFRGWLYGVSLRVTDDRCRSNRNRHHSI